MAKELDPVLAEALRAVVPESDRPADPDEPLPGATKLSPRSRTRLFNVRLTSEQLSEIREVAARRHLPASTMARSWLLERLEQERAD